MRLVSDPLPTVSLDLGETEFVRASRKFMLQLSFFLFAFNSLREQIYA